MYLPGLLLIIVVALLLYNVIPQRGGATPAPTTVNPLEGNYFQRQYGELRNIRDFLRRPLQEAKKNIAELIPANAPNRPGSHPLELVDEPNYYLDFKDEQDPDPLTTDDLALVRELQPKHLGLEPLIVTISGRRFYYDAKYPEGPISIDFARNPIKFQKENPSVYPSYAIGRSWRGTRRPPAERI